MRRGGEHHRLLQRRAGARRQRMLAVAAAIPCPGAVADEALAGEGLMHHAEHRPSRPLQPDQRPPHRQTGDEGPRPVDRVEHPDMFGVEPLRAVFLAENAVIGMVGADQRPHRRLRRPIRHRHRIERRALELVFHRHARPKVRQDRRAGRIGQPIQKDDQVVGRRGVAHDGRILVWSNTPSRDASGAAAMQARVTTRRHRNARAGRPRQKY